MKTLASSNDWGAIYFIFIKDKIVYIEHTLVTSNILFLWGLCAWIKLADFPCPQARLHEWFATAIGGESHRQGMLVVYFRSGHEELDMTEAT